LSGLLIGGGVGDWVGVGLNSLAGGQPVDEGVKIPLWAGWWIEPNPIRIGRNILGALGELRRTRSSL